MRTACRAPSGSHMTRHGAYLLLIPYSHFIILLFIMPETGVVAALYREILSKANDIGQDKKPAQDPSEHGMYSTFVDYSFLVAY